MHQTNLTEIFREHQLALLREAEDRRLVRRLRVTPPQRPSRTGRRRLGAGFRREISPRGDGPASRSSGLRGPGDR
jgi:hypothetical protein